MGVWVVVLFPCGKLLISKQRLLNQLPQEVNVVYGFLSYELAFDYVQKTKKKANIKIIRNTELAQYIFE